MRLQLDQTRKSFDHCRFANAGLAHEHRRVRTLAMAEDLDDLLNLFFSSDCWWNLVLACEPIERNTKVFQVRWQLKLFAVELLFLFAFLHLCAYVFLHCFRVRSHRAQNVNEQSVLLTAQRVEDVSRLNYFAALTPGALHSSLEQIGGVGSNAESFASVLLPAVSESLFDGHFNDHRIQRQFTYRRVEHIGLFHSESLKNMFDRNEVLVAAA